jgi:cyclo(L-tyrosyl-L-tyrosyl) synthase
MNVKTQNEQIGAVIGISMLNPYFTRENIQATASSLRERFERLFFVLPDKPARYTLYGYGYTPEEAAKTTKRKFHVLERSCRESIEALALDNARVVRWDEIEPREEYAGALQALDSLQAQDAMFHDDVVSSTRSIYEHSQFPKKRPLSLEEQIEKGTPFLIQEVAFMLSSANILGIEKAVHIYHRDIPVLSSLLRGKYQINPPKSLGFEQVARSSRLRGM